MASTAGHRQFPTNFSSLMKCPPPLPTCLAMRAIADVSDLTSQHGGGKIKVVVRVVGVEPGTETCITMATDRRQIVLHDPTSSSSSRQRAACVAPRLFAFDHVFTPADPLANMCSYSLDDALQSVLSGSDSCIFSFGPARIGKTYTMIGVDDASAAEVGLIPSAISWLFQMIAYRRDRTGARFSVRVSAVELTGRDERLRDLLAHVSTSTGTPAPPGPAGIRDDDIRLDNVSEIRAPTAESAGFLLDAAIAARTIPESDEDARNSHLLFTIHVYQYKVDTSCSGQNSVAGGRSRLHIVDLGSCGRSRDGGHGPSGTTLSMASLGTVITALLSGQRQLPYRESRLTQLMREVLGGAVSHACALVHVTPAAVNHGETIQVVQLASRIQRTKMRRRAKASSCSDGSSCDGSSGASSSLQLPHWYTGERRRRATVKMGVSSRRSAHSDPETSSCVSGSGLSSDTVIHVGGGGRQRRAMLSDRECTDSETGSSVITSVSAKSLPSCASSKTLSDTSSSSLTHHVRSRRHPRQSHLPVFHHATILEHPDEEQWIDGPCSDAADNVAASTSEKNAPRRPTARNSKQVPSAAAGAELWVDGPVEFQAKGRQKCANSAGIVGSSSTATMPTPVKKVFDQNPAFKTLTDVGRRPASPRVGASKTSSLRNRTKMQDRSHLPPPDGRVAAWVQSVREAATKDAKAMDGGDLGAQSRELYHPDGDESVTPSSGNDELLCDSKADGSRGRRDDAVPDKDAFVVDEDARSSSESAASEHSLYERNVDDCLETGSQPALGSSDDDAMWDAPASSVVPADPETPTRFGGTPSDCPVEQFFNSVEICGSADRLANSIASFPNPVSCISVASGSAAGSSVDRDRRANRTVSSNARHDSPLSRRSLSTPRPSLLTPKPPRSASGGTVRGACEAGSGSMSDRPKAGLALRSSARSYSADPKDRTQKKTTSLNRSSPVCASPPDQEPRRSRLPLARRVGRRDVAADVTSPAEPGWSGTTNVRLLSPYHTVTSPRRAGGATASDNSSLLSDPVTVGSSGYESMLRGDDSDDVTAGEVTSSSTNQSLASECCSEAKVVGKRIKELTGSKRPGESSLRVHSPGVSTSQSVCGSAVLNVWTTASDGSDKQQNSQQFETAACRDSEKTERSKLTIEAETLATLKCIKRVDDLLERRRQLNADLITIKDLLGVLKPTDSSPENCLESEKDRSDPAYLHQLEAETVMLERRLRAYQSRVMLVTCFDSNCMV